MWSTIIYPQQKPNVISYVRNERSWTNYILLPFWRGANILKRWSLWGWSFNFLNRYISFATLRESRWWHVICLKIKHIWHIHIIYISIKYRYCSKGAIIKKLCLLYFNWTNNDSLTVYYTPVGQVQFCPTSKIVFHPKISPTLF